MTVFFIPFKETSDCFYTALCFFKITSETQLTTFKRAITNLKQSKTDCKNNMKLEEFYSSLLQHVIIYDRIYKNLSEKIKVQKELKEYDRKLQSPTHGNH